ncbi:MAG: 4Fe-4S binding protein [Alphaproteobacteria bacterium]
MGLTFAILFGVPLLGLARIDLFGGEHRALGHAVDLRIGLIAVCAAIAAFYAATFVVNLPAGRMFCGFGCPVGQLHRLADATDSFPRDPARRRRAWAGLGAFALALSTAVASWWTSPGAFVAGWPAAAIAWGSVLSVAAVEVVHARRFRWNFCRKLCPIGLYYSAVQSNAVVGLDFDRGRACTDCGACMTICPVHLDPRHLEAEIPTPGGLGFDGLPGANHCLHCGTCVEIYEHVTRAAPRDAALGLRRLRVQPMTEEAVAAATAFADDRGPASGGPQDVSSPAPGHPAGA